MYDSGCQGYLEFNMWSLLRTISSPTDLAKENQYINYVWNFTFKLLKNLLIGIVRKCRFSNMFSKALFDKRLKFSILLLSPMNSGAHSLEVLDNFCDSLLWFIDVWIFVMQCCLHVKFSLPEAKWKFRWLWDLCPCWKTTVFY